MDLLFHALSPSFFFFFTLPPLAFHEKPLALHISRLLISHSQFSFIARVSLFLRVHNPLFVLAARSNRLSETVCVHLDSLEVLLSSLTLNFHFLGAALADLGRCHTENLSKSGQIPCRLCRDIDGFH